MLILYFALFIHNKLHHWMIMIWLICNLHAFEFVDAESMCSWCWLKHELTYGGRRRKTGRDNKARQCKQFYNFLQLPIMLLEQETIHAVYIHTHIKYTYLHYVYKLCTHILYMHTLYTHIVSTRTIYPQYIHIRIATNLLFGVHAGLYSTYILHIYCI